MHQVHTVSTAIPLHISFIGVTLYDWSGIQLDPQTLGMLHHYQTILQHMVSVFQGLQSQAMTTATATQQGRSKPMCARLVKTTYIIKDCLSVNMSACSPRILIQILSFFSGQKDLDTKLNVVTLIQQHLQVVLWFYSEGLLPENSGT